MNIDEMLDGRTPPAAPVLGRGVRPWLYAAAPFGMMGALFDPAIALAHADACPERGHTHLRAFGRRFRLVLSGQQPDGLGVAAGEPRSRPQQGRRLGSLGSAPRRRHCADWL